MSGFDFNELLPFYLDETEEQIVALNDALLRLEQEPTDAKSLREAFRFVHSIKGSSTVMGFEGVSKLTHHLETFFDRLRSGERTLNRSALNLCFRCLDEIRDYHRQLRAEGQSSVDLSGLTATVIAHLEAADSEPEPQPEPVAVEPADEPDAVTVEEAPEPAVAADGPAFEPSGAYRLSLEFEPELQWPDMKAKLVMTRLAGKARILATDPPSDRIEDVETTRKFTLWLAPEGDLQELKGLADVEGVSRLMAEVSDRPERPIEPETAPEPTAQEARLDAPPAAIQAPTVATPASIVPNETKPATTVESREDPDASSPVAPAPRPPAAETAARAAAEPRRPKVAETVRVDVDRLDHLMNLAGELVISRARFFEIARELEELFRGSSAPVLASETGDRIEELARGLEGLAGVDEGTSARLSGQLKRLRDQFSVIQGELDLIRQGRECVGSMAEVIHQLSKVADGIQKGVLETRMVPIGPLFERFHRVIRDLRLSSNKEVVLKIDGEGTELDKRMIDELGDPLIHMVRNSVDHGLEAPEQREAAGKSRAGTVWLSASHRGNSVVITVRDDGRGIDCERVRRKAVASGLIGDEESRRLSERQLIQFIWHPGLSTAERVTDISGRGVGMDIVKSRIENLNGTVDVRTELGRGTTFSIRLPLTLAIMPVLLVQIHDEVYAIPQDHVDEIVEVGNGQVHGIHGRKTIEIRGRIISLMALDDVFRWGDGAHPSRRGGPDGAAAESDRHTIVVVQDGETTIGLKVDHLIGMQEVVLKSLEKNYRTVPCLSGASVLGDGRVALILDVDAVIARVGQTPAELDRAAVGS